MTEIGTIVAFVGLGTLVSFSATNKHMSVGPVSAIMGMLVIPAAISLLWRISNDFGWWTVAIFIGVSLFTGTVNATYARKSGIASLYSMQPILGAMFVGSSVACWFL